MYLVLLLLALSLLAIEESTRLPSLAHALVPAIRVHHRQRSLPIKLAENNNLESDGTQRADDQEDIIVKSDNGLEDATLFGIEKKTVGVSPQVPLFTGSLVLLGTTALTIYGFYVFFTGEDPAMDMGFL